MPSASVSVNHISAIIQRGIMTLKGSHVYRKPGKPTTYDSVGVERRAIILAANLNLLFINVFKCKLVFGFAYRYLLKVGA